MTQIARPDDTVVATFEYDALGRRIEKVDTIAGITARFYYDDQRIALQTSVSGGTETDSRYFVYGNYIDEVLLMSVIPAQAGIHDYYYAHDHLYSPVTLFESAGDLVERYEYDVYGSVRILSPNYELRTISSFGNPYTFTGRELDSFDCTPPAACCKLYYYRARSYDPQTGRFLQRDPMQYIDGMNLYEYSRSSPIFYSDPQGLSVRKSVCKWVKGVWECGTDNKYNNPLSTFF